MGRVLPGAFGRRRAVQCRRRGHGGDAAGMSDGAQLAPVLERAAGPVGSPNVALRAFPWPYRAMLAICSDIDDESPRHFAALHRFLNTREMTPLGRGLG